MIIEIPKIDNTINGTTLFWRWASTGLILAIVITIYLKRKKSLFDEYSETRIGVHFGLFLGLFLLLPGIGSLINHSFASNETNCIETEIKRKSLGASKLRSRFIFPTNPVLQNERFDVTNHFYNQIEQGDTIITCLKEGALGYTFVDQFKLNQ